VTTKDIRTAQAHVACDVCGRTLLRGEHAETYLSSGTRRAVCELCTPRAVHAGWVREGAVLERGTREAPGERRRSLVDRLRRARGGGGAGHRTEPREAPLAPRPGGNGWHRVRPEPASERLAPTYEPRERHVRAVPTSVEQRTASALEHFNASEHPRTIAGVARSLGVPAVVARPLPDEGGLVSIVVAWELCWYRFEVDLSDGGPSVRASGQGYELTELAPEDRAAPNAHADERGALTPA